MSELEHLNAIHFRQIDFLRTFLIARDMGLVKRKRKMPSQYIDDVAARTACRKLLRQIIKHYFPDFSISASYGNYSISVPYDMSQLITTVRNECSSERISADDPIRDSVRTLTARQGCISPRNTYIDISLGFHGRDRSSYAPSEIFYLCAEDIRSFASEWLSALSAVCERGTEIQERVREINARMREERAATVEARRLRLHDREQQSRLTAQQRFDQALAATRRER